MSCSVSFDLIRALSGSPESKAGSPKDEEASEAGDKGEQEEELATPPLLERFVEEEKEAAPSKDGTPCGGTEQDQIYNINITTLRTVQITLKKQTE